MMGETYAEWGHYSYRQEDVKLFLTGNAALQGGVPVTSGPWTEVHVYQWTVATRRGTEPDERVGTHPPPPGVA